MRTKTANKSENIFIKEWNGTEFNLSIPAKVTNSNKPFIYFYWPNKLKGGILDRARKGGVGGVNDSRLKVKKNAGFAVDAITQMLSKGWDPFTNEFIQIGITVTLNPLSPISKCCEHWILHREERYENEMIGKTALKNNKIVIAHFKDWLERHNYLNRKIGSFTSIDIDNFFGFKAKERKWGKVTYNTYRTDLNTFFKYLKKQKVISENPVEDSVKKNTTNDSSRFVIYEEEELEKIVNLMRNDSTYFGLFVASKMLYSYNIRPIEMTRLQIQDINWKKGTLTLPPHKTKNEKEAVFELNQEVSDLLYQLTTNLPEEYFIFGHRCKPGKTSVEEQYFGQKFRYFRHKYNIGTHLKFYALKHSSNFYDLEDGASFYSIMEKNRHASLQITTAYIKGRLQKKTIKPTQNNRF